MASKSPSGNNSTDANNKAALVAKIAVDHYHMNLKGGRGKPQKGKEWTVYAAIVAVLPLDHDEKNLTGIDDCRNEVTNNNAGGGTDDEEYNKKCVGSSSSSSSSSSIPVSPPLLSSWVVSCATGSKCTRVDAAVQSLPVNPCRLRTTTENDRDTAKIRKNEDNGEKVSRGRYPRDESGSSCECCTHEVEGMILHDSHAEGEYCAYGRWLAIGISFSIYSSCGSMIFFI